MPNDRFHGVNLRKHRFSESNRTYLVTTCCLSRDLIFSKQTFGRLLVDEIWASDQSGRSHTYAFVVMPDHLHWLVQLGNRHTLSSVVKRVKGRSAIRINKRRGKSGSIWQPGFHEHCVRKEESLEAIGDYIIHNPVRAGLVERADDYSLSDLIWKRFGSAVRD